MFYDQIYDWWCGACEEGVDEGEDENRLEEDSEGYVLCPRCGNPLIGFDERPNY